MLPPRIAILATGDELIEGKTINTNAAAISQHLFSEGFKPGLQMTCGDKEQDIIDCLSHLSSSHDLLITIGGLGPTSDDRTRFAVSKFLNLPLIYQDTALAHIINLTKRPKIEPGDKQQSLFPKEAILLANPYGTALGGIIQLNNLQVIMLPGPPRECLPMFQHLVLPLLKENAVTPVCRLSWLVFAVREEYLGRQLDHALASFHDCETGYRLDTPYVECKIRCRFEDEAEIKNLVENLFKPHFLISQTQKSSELLRQLLSRLRRPLVILDNATAGLLQQLLSTPETLPYLTFLTGRQRPDTKIDFECDGLETYWNQTNELENSIQFKSYINDTCTKVERTFPFKSKLVIDMAAEWLCAQLFTCLN